MHLDLDLHALERRELLLRCPHQWLQHVGLLAPVEEIEGDAELVAGARSVLDEGVHELADTVRNSLNFYRMQESAETVESAVLTGPATSIPGFAARLSELLRLPLEGAVIAPEDDGAELDVGRLTVAAGLAVDAPV